MAGIPFIVSGTITLSDATHPSSARVTIRNDRTVQSGNVNTNSSGQYVYDLSNLTDGYNQGDSITVIFAYGLEEIESTFTVSGAEETVDMTSAETLASADAEYATITEVYEDLDDKTTTDITAQRIRDYLVRAEAEIDVRTGTSFKSNTSTDEVYDLNLQNLYESPNVHLNVGLARSDGGISSGTRTQLLHKPIISVTSLSTNGAGATSVDDWTAITEHTGAVAGDFTAYKNTGIIEWLQNCPSLKRRAFKLTYTWGLDRTSTDAEDVRKMELVRQLAILIAERQILQSKGSGSQFEDVNDISLESISTSNQIGGHVTYLQNLRLRIEELFMELGNLTGYKMGLSGGY